MLTQHNYRLSYYLASRDSVSAANKAAGLSDGRFSELQLSCTVHAIDGLLMHTLPTSYNHDAYAATAVGTHSRCLLVPA